MTMSKALSRAMRGFTLVELMIVVAIVGILGAIAYPSYTSSVAKGRRADAQKVLLEAAQYMQRYYVANNSYMDQGGLPPVLPATLSSIKTGAGVSVYDVTVSAATQTGFTVTATPNSSGLMSRDECGTFVLDSTGRRSLQNSSKAAGDCWR